MRYIVKKGCDIPLKGTPAGPVQNLLKPKQISLNLDPFEMIRFKLLVKPGDSVKIGEPLVENKSIPGQFFVSPASGTIAEIRRGLKRRLLDIVIDLDSEENYFEHPLINERSSREEILDFFMRSGLFPHIRMRPFDLIASPKFLPRAIFVRAIETLPFTPAAEMQVEGHDAYFQAGLDVLSKLSEKVHLVFSEGSSSQAFIDAKGVDKHTIRGPHPAGSSSLHIHLIAPIKSPEDYVWTLSTVDVITVGKMAREGRYFTDRIFGIGGEGIATGKTGYFKGRMGYPLSKLLEGRTISSPCRLISGDPLTGNEAHKEDFIGFYQTVFSSIPENFTREAFHFLRPGLKKYTATRAYASGHRKPPEEGFSFTTNQHGEERPFIDGAVYDRVMPMRIPTMHLVKAILSEDFDLAVQLGLLEVTGDDFALPTFICPSKIEMIQIVNEGLHRYSKEMGH